MVLKGEDVNGPSSTNFVSEVSSHILLIHLDQKSESLGLESKADRFWVRETIGILGKEKQSQEHFIEYVYLGEKNWYETKLPFKESHALLHDAFDLCKKRLEGLHARLKQDPYLLAKCNDIFIAQKEAGVIEEAPDSCEAGECYYLPYHPVVKEIKHTTKVYIVFDVSATNEGPSLNKCLYKGPQLTPLIFDIFLRF